MAEDFSFGEMLEMQKQIREKYDRYWGKLRPEVVKDKLLWMIGEASEVGDIIKKNGELATRDTPQLRAHFIEEMCDVMMYYNEILMCMDVSTDELKKAYVEKFNTNMQRWYKKEEERRLREERHEGDN